LLSIVLLSFWSMVAREAFSQGAVVVVPLVRHLNLLLAFVGAALAARESKLLRLATGELRDRWKGGKWIAFGTALVSCAVTGMRVSFPVTPSMRRTLPDFLTLPRK